MNLSPKKRTGMFAAILVSCIACSMLSTALNTALPQIMDEFQVNASTGQWLTSIYSLVMGIYGLAVGAAPIFAPTAAGIIVDLSGWRMIFYIVFAIALFSLILAAITFENVLEHAEEKFDECPGI